MIKKKSLAMVTAAVVLGLIAAWIANSWVKTRMASVNTEEDTKPVVVAALDIPFGQKIDATHLRLLNWPTKSLPGGAFTKVSDVEGKIANQQITAGDLLLPAKIVDHTSGSTLSAIITPGKRAVTVRVNDVIGVAGFLLPGNRVDIYATRMEKRRAYTNILLQDIKVLAVDQTASPDKDKPIVVRAVTLELKPKEAEKLVRATQEGTVQLALRNPLDKPKKVAVRQPPHRIRHHVIHHTKPKPKVKQPDITNITVIRGTTVDVSKGSL